MAKPETNSIEVIATARGYYGGMVREAGDRFVVTGETNIGSWMKPVEVKPEPKPEPKPKPKPAPKQAPAKADDI